MGEFIASREDQRSAADPAAPGLVLAGPHRASQPAFNDLINTPHITAPIC